MPLPANQKAQQERTQSPIDDAQRTSYSSSMCAFADFMNSNRGFVKALYTLLGTAACQREMPWEVDRKSEARAPGVSPGTAR